MKVKIYNEQFAEAVNEELKKSNFGDDEKFRLAVETIAKELFIASEWSGASPPAIAKAAVNVLCRIVFNSF